MGLIVNTPPGPTGQIVFATGLNVATGGPLPAYPIPVGRLLFNQDFSYLVNLSPAIWGDFWTPENLSIVGGQLQLVMNVAGTQGAVLDTNAAGTQVAPPNPGFLFGPYGYYEAKVTIPTTATNASAWMAGVIWPQDGEFDVAEINSANHLVIGNYHWSNPELSIAGTDTGVTYLGAAHIFGMLWTPTRVNFYVDDVLQMSVVNNRIIVATPQWLQFDYATGGGSTKMLVNYVRCWALPTTPVAPVLPFIQCTTADDMASSPSQITLNNVTAGDQLVIVHNVQGGTQQAITGVTGGEATGHTWAVLGATQAGGYWKQDTEIWWLDNAAGGTATVFVAYSGTNYGASAGAWLGEFRGLTGADGVAVVNTGTSAAPSVTTGNPSQAGDLALAVGIMSNYSLGPNVSSPVFPWVNDPGPLVGTDPTLPVAFQPISGSAAVTATWGFGLPEAWAAMAVLLKTY